MKGANFELDFNSFDSSNSLKLSSVILDIYELFFILSICKLNNLPRIEHNTTSNFLFVSVPVLSVTICLT